MEENLSADNALEDTIDDAVEQVTAPLSDYLSEPVLKVLSVVIILIAGLVVLKVLLHLVKRTMEHSGFDDVLHTFVLSSIKVVFMLLLVLTILGYLGIPMTPFITMLGACGAAVALALKDSLANFAGGILIILNQPFKKGDFIECSGVTGRVQEIHLIYSTLTTPNKVISMPNGILANQTVVNFSEDENRRVDCQFSISYDSDVELAKSIISNAINSSDYFKTGRKSSVGVAEHGDSAIVIDALAWCSNDDYYNARYYLMEEVKKEFDNAGIQIPYPQLTVHKGE